MILTPWKDQQEGQRGYHKKRTYGRREAEVDDLHAFYEWSVSNINGEELACGSCDCRRTALTRATQVLLAIR